MNQAVPTRGISNGIRHYSILLFNCVLVPMMTVLPEVVKSVSDMNMDGRTKNCLHA